MKCGDEDKDEVCVGVCCPCPCHKEFWESYAKACREEDR